MRHFLIFAGTTEGRQLAEQLSQLGARVSVSVATVYGKHLVPESEQIEVHAKRLTADEMADWFTAEHFDEVIDATHPYAVEVTANIKAACKKTETHYLRLIRESIHADDCVYTATTEEAAAFLNTTTGNVLLTTGSKELSKFMAVKGYKKRLYPRVLPTLDAVGHCVELGFTPSHILAMQGPFSEEMNTATLQQIQAEYMVTKDSGDVGGFEQKLAAAKKAGALLVVIGRPQQEAGFSMQEIVNRLTVRYGLGGKLDHVRYFPLFVNLKGKRVVVIGAGVIAQRRIRTLVQFGCTIVVIAPQIDEKLKQMRRIEALERVYEPGDCTGAALVCAATDNRTVNRLIAEECHAQNIPVSVADSREECSFYFPAVIIEDNVVVGVTASGENHTQVRKVAENIRAFWDVLLDKEYEGGQP